MQLFITSRRRRAAVLVEYGLVIAGVSLVAAAAVSIFGHKTSDLFAAVATILPGAHADDNGPIVSGKLIETAQDGTTGNIALDVAGITAANNTERLGNNLVGPTPNGTTPLNGLIVEAADN